MIRRGAPGGLSSNFQDGALWGIKRLLFPGTVYTWEMKQGCFCSDLVFYPILIDIHGKTVSNTRMGNTHTINNGFNQADKDLANMQTRTHLPI